MQVSIQLYPVASYPNGIPFDVSIDLLVPSVGTPVTIEKVHLVGKEIFMLCKVSEQRSVLCALGTSTAKVKVLLPKGTTDIKVNRYVLGKTWGWSDPSYAGMKFISNESDYNKAVAK